MNRHSFKFEDSSDSSEDEMDGGIDEEAILKRLFNAATIGNENLIKNELGRHRQLVDKKLNGETMLLAAARENNTSICKTLLIEYGADAKIADNNEITPLHRAAENGNEEICKLLLNKDADINANGGDGQGTPLHICASCDFPVVLKVLLNSPKLELNRFNTKGQTALMCAIAQRNKNCVKVFITHDKWQELLSTSKSEKHGKINTPMRQLIRLMPDMAMVVMSRCIEVTSSCDDPSDPDFEVRFNFQFLDDSYTSRVWKPEAKVCDQMKVLSDITKQRKLAKDELDAIIEMGSDVRPSVVDGIEEEYVPERRNQFVGMETCDKKIFDCDTSTKCCKVKKKAELYTDDCRIIKENHPLTIMRKCEEEKFLSDMICHPLSIALINYKWISIGRTCFYLSLLVYSIFTVLFTAHVLLVEMDANTARNISARNVTNSTLENTTSTKKPLSGILLGFALILFLTEIYMFYAQRLRYLRSFANYIEVLLYVSAIILASNNAFNLKINLFELSVICMFFAWFNLLLRMRKLPYIGIFLIMFTTILQKAAFVITIFVPLLCAFCFTFNLLLGNTPLFRLQYVFASIFVMISGELDYMDTLSSGSTLHPDINYTELALAAYVVFVIFMVICLLNMLVGLAVSDVEKVYKKSVTEKMLLKLDEVFYCEFDLSKFRWLRLAFRGRKKANGCLWFKPNQKRVFLPTSKNIPRNPTSKNIPFYIAIKEWIDNREFNDRRLSALRLLRLQGTQKRKAKDPPFNTDKV